MSTLQIGIKQHNSTQALLKLTDDIRGCIDRKKVITWLLLFDFSKAFDTISLSRLLRILRDLGFSRTAPLWIKSHLQGRTQRVIIQTSGD